MKSYRLDPNKLPKQRNRVMILYGISLLVLLSIALALNWGQDSIKSLLWMIPLMLILFAYSAYRAVRQRQLLWEGYALELYDDHLITRQPTYPELRVNKSDVTGLEEKKFGALLSTRQGRNVMVISREMPDADFDEVVSVLRGWVTENDLAEEVE